MSERHRRRIVIAGASGFIGRALVAHLTAAGDVVHTIGRSNADALWSDPDAVARIIEGADALIGLAGKSVDCRYTLRNQNEIRRSRVETTRQLREACAAASRPPAVWINASTATIYRHAEDRPMTESTGEIGAGFSVDVARAWERELFAGDLPETRRVALRISIVLGDGSALTPLLALARFGLGGPQLDGRWPGRAWRRRSGVHHVNRRTRGRQMFSWVHIDDVVRVVDFAIGEPDVSGPVNVASPAPVTNRELMATLRRVVRRPLGLPAFRWMLEFGSALIGTETELVLKSRWLLPEKLTRAGFSFRFPSLEPAVEDIVRQSTPPRP